MAKAEGMAIAPWNVLAAGKIRTDAEEEERRKTGEKGMYCNTGFRGIALLQFVHAPEDSDNCSRPYHHGPAMGAQREGEEGRQGPRGGRFPSRSVQHPSWSVDTLLHSNVYASMLTDIAALRLVAIAYVMQKVPYVFPIIGGRKVEQLRANLEALDIALTDEHMKKIESAVPFELGFPGEFIVSCTRNFYSLDDADSRIGVRATAANTASAIRCPVILTNGLPFRRSARRRISSSGCI